MGGPAAGGGREPDLLDPSVPEWDTEQRLLNEKEVLGFYLSGHPLRGVWDRAQRLGVVGTGQLAQVEDGARVLLCGLVSALREINTKNGNRMGFATIEDVEGTIEVTIFPELFRQSVAHLRSGAPLLVRGKVEGTTTARKLLADDVRPLPAEAERARRGATPMPRACRVVVPPDGSSDPLPGAPGDLRGAPRHRAAGPPPPGRRQRGRRPLPYPARASVGGVRRGRGGTPGAGQRHRRGLTGSTAVAIDLEKALDFERPLLELEGRIDALRRSGRPGTDGEVGRLEERLQRLQRKIFGKLTAWQRVQLARHPRRPYTLDLIPLLTEDFVELHGDRLFGDDHAIVGGLARLEGRPIVVVGHQKGRDTEEKLHRNFGMPHPEGYRKALRLMQLAERFRKPILTLIDTPGAYPGVGAEERGQAEAIARNLREMAGFPTPIVAVVTGEGGAEARSRSAWRTASSCSSTRSTR